MTGPLWLGGLDGAPQRFHLVFQADEIFALLITLRAFAFKGFDQLLHPGKTQDEEFRLGWRHYWTKMDWTLKACRIRNQG